MSDDDATAASGPPRTVLGIAPWKLGLLTSLYLSQGLPFGFFTQALPVLLRKSGMGLPAIGLTSLLALPWMLKALWAPWIDRHRGSPWGARRGFLIPLQAAAVAATAALAFVNDVVPAAAALTVLMAAVVVTNLIAATQDIATDGVAVDILDDSERGLGNGVQVAAYRVGMVIGGGALLVVFDRVGWRAAFLSMAVLLLVASVPVWRWRERPTAASTSTPSWRESLSLLRRPGVPLWLSLIALYKLGDALASGMVRPFLSDRGATLTEIGALLGAGGSVAGLIGALLGGACAVRFGRRNALLGCGVVHAAMTFLYAAAALAWIDATALGVVAVLEHLTGGMATVALFTAMMDICAPETGATDYTIQASVVVFATGAGGLVSGFLADALGYAGLFALGGVVSVVGAVVIAGAFARGLTPAVAERGTGLHRPMA